MTADLFQILNISQMDMLQRVKDLDVVSSNLSNVNTAGYKRSRANFQELISGLEQAGTHLSSTQVIMDQGSLKITNNPLDLAVTGEGFFSVTMPDGSIGFTRDGEFHVDSNRQLVNASGYRVVWKGQIPAGTSEVSVTPNGQVLANQNGAGWTQVGTIQLARFINPSGLIDNGENILLQSPASGAPQNGTPETTGFGSIASGAVEQANVDLGDELTHMISLQRAFQLSTRAFQQTDEMIAEAIAMRKA